MISTTNNDDVQRRRLFGRVRIADDGGIFLADALAVLTAQTSASAKYLIGPPDYSVTWTDATGEHILCWASELPKALEKVPPQTRSGRNISLEEIQEFSEALDNAQNGKTRWWSEELERRAKTLAFVATAFVSMENARVPPSKRLKRGIRELAQNVEEALG